MSHDNFSRWLQPWNLEVALFSSVEHARSLNLRLTCAVFISYIIFIIFYSNSIACTRALFRPDLPQGNCMQLANDGHTIHNTLIVRYVYALISGVSIFEIGAVFTIKHGVTQLYHPSLVLDHSLSAV